MAMLFPLRLVQYLAHSRLPVSIVDLYEADPYHVRVNISFCELFPNSQKKEQKSSSNRNLGLDTRMPFLKEIIPAYWNEKSRDCFCLCLYRNKCNFAWDERIILLLKQNIPGKMTYQNLRSSFSHVWGWWSFPTDAQRDTSLVSFCVAVGPLEDTWPLTNLSLHLTKDETQFLILHLLPYCSSRMMILKAERKAQVSCADCRTLQLSTGVPVPRSVWEDFVLILIENRQLLGLLGGSVG